MTKTILLTGSAGLIGNALAYRLRCLGWRTIGMDIRGAPDVLMDIRESTTFVSQLYLNGIIHLAAVSRVIDGERDPKLCRSVNVEGTRAVLAGALGSRNLPWMIYASSREVYGQQRHLPVTEDAPLSPMNTYAASKVEAEKALADGRAAGLKVAVVRFSNVYGSVNDHADRVVPAFAATSARGSSLRVDGTDTTLDFTHLDDVVDGIVRLITLLESDKPQPIAIQFVSGVPTTLGALASLAVEFGRNGTQIVEADPRSFDVSKFYGDPALAARLLSWSTKIDLRLGFSQLVAEFKRLNDLKFDPLSCSQNRIQESPH
jgi:nucleoside-diphosphate-sugar epimerase